MKKTCVVIKTNPEGKLEFWTGNFNFSPEYPDARIVTTANAREIATACASHFPGHGVEIVRNYGLKTATGVMF